MSDKVLEVLHDVSVKCTGSVQKLSKMCHESVYESAESIREMSESVHEPNLINVLFKL